MKIPHPEDPLRIADGDLLVISFINEYLKGIKAADVPCGSQPLLIRVPCQDRDPPEIRSQL